MEIIEAIRTLIDSPGNQARAKELLLSLDRAHFISSDDGSIDEDKLYGFARDLKCRDREMLTAFLLGASGGLRR